MRPTMPTFCATVGRNLARRPDSSRDPSRWESHLSPHVSQSNVTSHSPRQNARPQARTRRRQAIPALLSRDCRLLRATGGLRRRSNKIAFAEHGDDGETETRRPLRDSRNLKSDRFRPDRLRLAPPRLPISDSSAFSAAGLPPARKREHRCPEARRTSASDRTCAAGMARQANDADDCLVVKG